MSEGSGWAGVTTPVQRTFKWKCAGLRPPGLSPLLQRPQGETAETVGNVTFPLMAAGPQPPARLKNAVARWLGCVSA